jgi:hypothetical protein
LRAKKQGHGACATTEIVAEKIVWHLLARPPIGRYPTGAAEGRYGRRGERQFDLRMFIKALEYVDASSPAKSRRALVSTLAERAEVSGAFGDQANAERGKG